MNTLLEMEARAYARLRESLMAQFELAEDDEALTDTLEGETSLHEVIIRAAREAQRRAAMADAMAEIIKANQERKARHQRAAEAIRDAIAHAMSDAALKKAEAPDMTISFRVSAPKAEVVDEAQLPAWAMKAKMVADKAVIKAQFESAPDLFECPGVVVTNGAPVVTIRTR